MKGGGRVEQMSLGMGIALHTNQVHPKHVSVHHLEYRLMREIQKYTHTTTTTKKNIRLLHLDICFPNSKSVPQSYNFSLNIYFNSVPLCTSKFLFTVRVSKIAQKQMWK